MGCFLVEKNKKKISGEQCGAIHKSINLHDNKPAILPEPSSPCHLGDRYESFSCKGIPHGERQRLINTVHLPKPLPIPPQSTHNGMEHVSLNAVISSPKWGSKLVHPEPMPLPIPKTCYSSMPTLQSFAFDEILAACDSFHEEKRVAAGSDRVVYKASFKVEATVTRLIGSTQSYKEFLMEAKTMASLEHPHLCRLIGVHARESHGDRILVYERLAHGSLDRLLYGNGYSSSSLIGWWTRMRIALGAAQGLAYLHEEGPFQAMYSEFKASNVQIDDNFNPKLSDYGFASFNPKPQVPWDSPMASAYLAPETLSRGLLTPKSNVWSFGIMLLELLTGRKNMDCRHHKEERDLVKWCVPFLREFSRLVTIMDPTLNISRSLMEVAKIVADLALRCLNKEPLDRPTMRTVVEILNSLRLPHMRRISSLRSAARNPTWLSSPIGHNLSFWEKAC